MPKFIVQKTTVLNRSSRDNSVLEEVSEVLSSFETREAATEFMATLDLPEEYGDVDIFKEIREEDEN